MLLSMIVGLTLTSFTYGENPAVQVILTNKGLQYGKHVGAGWVQDKLENVTFPDISGKFGICIFGHVYYTITGTTITKCDFPEPSLEFDEQTTGFKTSVSGLSVALTGDWMTRYGLIHESGSFNMAIFNVDVTSVVELGRDPDGHLSVTSVSCEAHIEDVDLQIQGGSSWLIQHIVDHFRSRTTGEIQDKICPYVDEYITNVEQHLQGMKVSFNVTQDITLDLPLTDSPVVDASSLNLGLKGELYSTKTHKDPPFEAQSFTLPEQPNYMLSVGLSEFTLNSASYGYFSADLLQVLINDSMIPPSCPVRLNTSSMRPYIPQLPDMYPGLLMNLKVYARDTPLFTFQNGAIKLDLLGTVKAFAIQPNGTQTPLFKLNVDSDFSGKAWIADEKLKGSMGMNNLTLTLAASEVGPFKTDALEKLVKAGAVLVLTKLNGLLAKGFDLPRMKTAVLVDTVLEVKKGFIAISSNGQVLQTETSTDQKTGQL